MVERCHQKKDKKSQNAEREELPEDAKEFLADVINIGMTVMDTTFSSEPVYKELSREQKCS